MPREDRDRNFEKALARHLRPENSSGLWPAAEGPEQHPNCPDAEILAAYHERLLSPDELNFWKGHIAGCARCQEILAQLEITNEVSVSAENDELILQVAARAPIAAVAVPSAAASPAELRVPAAAQIRGVPSIQRGSESTNGKIVSISRWRWLAPAGAVAAGLLVWVVIHEKKTQTVALPMPVQIAANQPVPASPPLDRGETPSKNETPLGDTIELRSQEQKTQSSNLQNKAASADERARNDLTKRQRVEQFSPSASSGNRMAEQGAKDANGITQQHGTKALPSLRGGNFSSLSNLKREPNMAASQPAPPPAPQLGAATESVEIGGPIGGITDDKLPVGAPQQRSSADTESKKKPDESASVTSSKAAMSRSYQESALSAAKPQSPSVVRTRDNSSIWRVGSSGLIEESSDAGSTWTPQASGVTADLMAGSAPNGLVCWAVGRAGTILRTIDGGAHWTKIPAPIADDLGAIYATDATHAMFWDVPRRQSYTTSDGGLTWTSLVKP